MTRDKLLLSQIRGGNFRPETKVLRDRGGGLSPGTNRAIIKLELTMRFAATFQSELKTAPKCTFRLRMSYPRVGMNLVPSNARPFLFGCD